MADDEKNLIVNFIPSIVTEEEFRQLFEQIGEIASCKLMSDIDGQSKGFGFVSFTDPAHADVAIKQINGLTLQGKHLKVAYAKADRNGIRSESNDNSNVYVAGLPPNVTEDELNSLFSPFGTIAKVNIIDKQGAGRGIAFVCYLQKSDADDAIAAMQDKILPGTTNPLQVKFAIPAADKKPKPMNDLQGHVKTTSNNHDMMGTALIPSVRYNPMGNRTPAVPTIPPEVLRVVASSGMSVLPASGHSAMVNGQVASLYVYGLPITANEITVYELFSPFGGILNVRPIMDLTKEGKPCKGFAFVNFRKYEEACIAMVAMNGYTYEGKPLQVSFKNGDSSGGGNQQQQQQQQQSPYGGNYSQMPGSMGAQAMSNNYRGLKWESSPYIA